MIRHRSLARPSSLRLGMPALLVACLATAALCAAEPANTHWSNFRGPNFNGSAEATGLPDRWSPTEGIAWSTPLPGRGSATPAIWGDRLFLNAADAGTGDLLAMCLDAADGKVLWQHAHGKNRRQGNNDMTSPSPVTDGRHVIFLFGTGNLIAYDFAGKQLWARDLVEEFGTLSWLFGYGASPLLYQDRLYVQMMRRPTHRSAPADTPLESFLLAIDPATGKDLWRQARPAEARDESWESYMTPIPHARSQIVLAGADAVTGHDAATGQELWRRDFNDRRARNWRLVPTPVSDDQRIYVALPRGVSLVALQPGQEAAPLDDHTAWSMTANAPDVCSPLLYDGRLYVLDGDRRVITCLNPQTGKQLWRGELGGRGVIRSSPTAADGKIFFIDENGLAFVLAAGDEFKILSQIDMGGGQPARSSIAIAANRLYVRTADALYCVPASSGD